MRITRIRCYHYNQAFTVPFDSLQTRRSHADSIIVRIDCGSQASGFGESAPRRYVTGEDAPSVLKVINTIFAPILLTQPFSNQNEAADLLTRCEAACRQRGLSAYLSALGAVDLALLDALRQSGNMQTERFCGPYLRDRLPFSASVPFLPMQLIQDYFPLLTAKLDIQVIKILIDDNLERNLERVKMIREMAGQDKELRLEANGKLTFKQVEHQLQHLQHFNIAAIEQPLPPGDTSGLHKLRHSFDMAMIADESLVSIDDARQLIARGGYDIFNLKVSKCGGLLRARAIADLAAAHGIACHVGTHVGETELLGVAGRCLARTLLHFDAYGGGSPVLFSQLFNTAQPPLPETPSIFSADETVSRPCIEKILQESRLDSDIDGEKPPWEAKMS